MFGALPGKPFINAVTASSGCKCAFAVVKLCAKLKLFNVKKRYCRSLPLTVSNML